MSYEHEGEVDRGRTGAQSVRYEGDLGGLNQGLHDGQTAVPSGTAARALVTPGWTDAEDGETGQTQEHSRDLSCCASPGDSSLSESKNLVSRLSDGGAFRGHIELTGQGRTKIRRETRCAPGRSETRAGGRGGGEEEEHRGHRRALRRPNRRPPRAGEAVSVLTADEEAGDALRASLPSGRTRAKTTRAAPWRGAREVQKQGRPA